MKILSDSDFILKFNYQKFQTNKLLNFLYFVWFIFGLLKSIIFQTLVPFQILDFVANELVWSSEIYSYTHEITSCFLLNHSQSIATRNIYIENKILIKS